MSELRKYGVLLTTAKAIPFDLVAPDGVDLILNATFATGDVKISKDGGAEANTTNLPTDEGSGYSLILTLAELQCARAKIIIIDQTGTKVWLDITLFVDTYGNASAMHAFDLDTAAETMRGTDSAATATALATVDANVDLILVDTAEIGTAGAGLTNIGTIATVTTLTNKTGFSLSSTGLDAIVSTATGMVEIAKAIWDRALIGATHNIATSAGRRLRQLDSISSIDSSVNDVSATTTSFITALTSTIDDFYKSQLIIMTSGALNGQSRVIDSYNGTTKAVTFLDAWENVAPSDGDTFTLWATHLHSAEALADQVWDEATSGHATAGTTGKALTDALADTNELQTNQGNWLTATGFATETKQDIIDTNVDAILVDTGTTLPATLTAQDAVIDNLNSGIIYGSAATGTLTTTVATTDLTGYADDQLIGRVIVVLTGSAAGEATDITAYANASGQLTFTALTVAMANSDTFKIV